MIVHPLIVIVAVLVVASVWGVLAVLFMFHGAWLFVVSSLVWMFYAVVVAWEWVTRWRTDDGSRL